MAPKKDRSNFVFRGKSDQVLIKKPGDQNGSDFAIQNCTNCEIYIFDHLAQIFVDDSTNCKVFIGPTKSSVFMRDCSNMELHSSSSQLRISDTKNVRACVYSQSDPTLENTTGLVIAPYNFLYPGFADHFQAAGLVASEDKWSEVFDFTPNKEGVPNWKIMDPSEYPGPIVKEIEGVEGDTTCPIPIPRTYGGDSDIEFRVGSVNDSEQVHDGLHSFNINVSQKEAEKIFEAQTAAQVSVTVQEEPVFVEETQASNNFWEQEVPASYPVATNSSPQNNFWENEPQEQQIQYTSTPQNQQDYFSMHQQYQVEQVSHVPEKTILQKKEEELTKLMISKQEAEYTAKQQKRSASKAYLKDFTTQRQLQIKTQQKVATEEEQVSLASKKQEEGRVVNSWEKVSRNIALKSGEYPGSTDVSSMRSAILNKKSDFRP